MPIIEANRQRLFYEAHGDGDPLVLISGLGASRLFWWKQIGPLSAKYQLICPDNRGVGDSAPVAAPYSIKDMADDTAELIRALSKGPVHLLGISMGGFISATLAVHHPELVRKLILVSTSAGGPTHVRPSREILDMLIKSDGLDVEKQIRTTYTAIAGPGYMQNHPLDLDRIVRNALTKPLALETYLYQLNAVNDYATQGVNNRLDRITAPTLIIHGDADPLVPYANGCYLAEHIKGAHFLTYHEVGHLPPIEAEARFNSDIAAFLA